MKTRVPGESGLGNFTTVDFGMHGSPLAPLHEFCKVVFFSLGLNVHASIPFVANKSMNIML
jgi:hypothetical protein